MAEPGLGAEHTAERRRQLAALRPGQPCPRCGLGMYPGQPLDLDHVTPRSLGGAGGPAVLSHARCNRRAGALLGARLRKARGKPANRGRRHLARRACVICGAVYQPSRGDQQTCGRTCGWALRRRNAATAVARRRASRDW